MPYRVPVQPDNETVAAAKARLRPPLIAARRARPDADRRAARALITGHLQRELSGMTCIAAFLPLPSEPLDPAALDLLAVRARVLVPVVMGDAPLDWCQYVTGDGAAPHESDPPETRRGAFGIDEPTGPRLGSAAIAEADAIMVPALAVDRYGHRLGRGGGHYDRTLAMLARLRSATDLPPRMALIYDDELLPTVPFDDLDQRVTAVLRPRSGLTILG